MTTAASFRDHLWEHSYEPEILQVFARFQDQVERHQITQTDDRNFRCISRMTFQDGSFLLIDLTSVEDHLAFVPQGVYDPDECIVFHPEGVGAQLFDLVDAIQTAIRPELTQPLLDAPTMGDVLQQTLRDLEYNIIADWKKQDGPRPEQHRQPMTTNHQALHAVPTLIRRLETVRQNINMDEPRGLTAHSYLRPAAQRLLDELDGPERERFENLARRILRGEQPAGIQPA